MKTASISIWLAAGCAAAATAAAGAGTPLVAIGDGQPTSWTDAMNSGRLRAVNPATDGTPQPAVDFYQTQGIPAFVPSHLTPDIMVTDDLGLTRRSLVMQWNPPMQGETLAVASWEYDTLNLQRAGGLDLRGGSVHFSLLAPPGVWDVSFMLQDKNGRWCGWFMPMPPPNWSMQWIMFNQGNQGGWQKYGDPGFDLSNITAIRLDEAGRIGTFPPPPPGVPTNFWDWNAFDNITIVPSPGTPVLVAAAAVIALRRRR